MTEPDPHGHVWDGPTILIHTAELSTCSRCGCDPSDDAARGKCPRQNEDDLVARLLKFEGGARQQCTCRSDLENCRACDCGLAADVIVAQRKALLRLLARRDTLRTFQPRHRGGMWTATLVKALGAVGAARRPYDLVGIGATEQAAIEHLHSLEAADTWSADGKA